MPFDHPKQIGNNQATVSALTQQADEALAACERARCVDIIQQIYELLDSNATAYVVAPNRPHGRTARRVRSLTKLP